MLFREPENQRALYVALHPEDESVREEDCRLVTLQTVLASGLHNDLGLLVREQLILLAEAQSKFSVNVAFRMLLYMAKTYQDWAEEQKLSLYSETPIQLPRPELYMIYPGEKADVPEILRLSDLYGGKGDIEAEVRVLRCRGTGDIVDQYVRFCEIANGVAGKLGRTPEAAAEIIRQCVAENVLASFLLGRRKEVTDVMTVLYDQEHVYEMERYDIERRVAERVKREERENSVSVLVSSVQSMGGTREIAANLLVKQYNLTPEVAKAKVRQYWKSPLGNV